MRRLTENFWIAEGEPVSFLTLPFTTRMTVARLANGELWVHSPIRYTDALAAELATLGPVRYMVAPNRLHHLFLDDWRKHYPDAALYGTGELARKRTDLSFDGLLTRDGEYPWSEDIASLLFTGSPAMEEAVFLHRSSRTLIVTDLIENFPADTLSWLQRCLARFAGILAPNGRTPIDWRLSFLFGRGRARECLRAIESWQPERIVLAHGRIVETDAMAFLERSFRWLR
ncbi:DUF4336 domain-containing protein [Arhodomonas sp. AD133]|uniref:DUF4336 domain-containing protein n=1 Tax=Arhodomonas sp. AD133 TaxID=3415009 RepID=UPI003EBC4A13